MQNVMSAARGDSCSSPTAVSSFDLRAMHQNVGQMVRPAGGFGRSRRHVFPGPRPALVNISVDKTVTNERFHITQPHSPDPDRGLLLRIADYSRVWSSCFCLFEQLPYAVDPQIVLCNICTRRLAAWSIWKRPRHASAQACFPSERHRTFVSALTSAVPCPARQTVPQDDSF